MRFADIALQFRKDQQAKIDANSKVNASLLSKIPHELDNTAAVDQTQFQNILSDEIVLLGDPANQNKDLDDEGPQSTVNFDGNQTSVTELPLPDHH